MSYWWRLPDTSKVTGCLMALVDISGAVLPTETVPVSPSTWYEQSDFGGSFAGPIAPRLSLYEDYWCSVFWGKRGKKPTLKLVPGDSILLEYKMTPRDTSVADTIWGEMNAYYLGIEDHWATDVNPYLPTSVTRKMKLSGAYVAWSHGQILLAHPETGPVLVTNLRGQILSTRTRIDGTNTWIMPASPMPPGVYRLRWPKGQSVLVVPMR